MQESVIPTVKLQTEIVPNVEPSNALAISGVNSDLIVEKETRTGTSATLSLSTLRAHYRAKGYSGRDLKEAVNREIRLFSAKAASLQATLVANGSVVTSTRRVVNQKTGVTKTYLTIETPPETPEQIASRAKADMTRMAELSLLARKRALTPPEEAELSRLYAVATSK
jgi:hypothetical protein